ncbi:MAG: aldo/keto reductase [Chloroflexi bacterium]|nr:aldo/keto reductase [Chloroflexota bacterium]MCI0575171.1 aldo/keto reductase [Chloroflexota bacterium]MCI0647147.1 aldo/keto reductase [Chloroflexota bacterium]MCI0729977.1 aldo/keto reductase [Chloroflexota bacterium]
MEFRRLGNSGIDVSAFSLGSWLTYEFIAEKDALAVISRALELGVNFLDDARYDDRTGTAPMKTGYSEVIFGRLLRQGGWNRTDLVIANKLWYEFYPEESPEAELDGSLSRLQMDYLDLVYCAPPSASLAVADIVRQMDALIKTGKLSYWGILNWPVAQIEEAGRVAATEGLHPPCAAQLAYSLLARSPVEDEPARKIFNTTGIAVVASYSLYGGLLSGKYNRSEATTQGRFGAGAVESMRQQKLLEKANQVAGLAREMGCTPAQLALAYCLKNDQVASVLFGATKVLQVEENIRTLEILPRINQEVMARLHSL